MALTIGELTGFITLSDKGFGSAIQAAGKDLGRLQSTTSTTTARIEDIVEQAFREVAEDIARGVDPTEALAGLDRLTGAFDSAMGELETSARTGASGAASAIAQEFSGLDGELRSAGRSAGRAMVDGLEAGLDGAGSAGRRAGAEAADGVEQGGRGGMGGVGGAMIGALKAAPWVAAGAAIAGMVIDAMKTAIEREEIFTGLAIKVGAFGEESERLGKIAGEAYSRGYGESLEEVSEALAKIVQNVDGAREASDQALGGMTQNALTVSKAMDEDVGRVIAAVSSMLRNDLAPSAEDAFNVLLRGQQEGVNRGEDLADTFAEYSTLFRDLGLSAEDALGLLNQGLKAGAWNSDQVADGLKELDIRVKDLSAKDALKELGLDAEKMAKAFSKGGPEARKALDQILDRLRKVEDPAKRSQLAVELFGTKAEDMAQAINALDLDKAAKGIGEFENAVKQADKTFQDSSATRVEQWKRGWEDAWAWLGDKLTEQAMMYLPDPTQFEKDWNTVKEWFTETIPNFFSDLWNDVKNKTGEIWDGIGDWLQEKGQAIVDWLKEVPAKVGNFFSEGWEKIRSAASEKWESIKSAISEKVNAAIDWLKEAPGKIGNALSTGWDTIRSTASEKWEGIKKAVTDKAQQAIDWLKQLPDKIKSALSDAGQWLVQVGRDMIQGLINGIKDAAGQVAKAAKDVVNNAIRAAKEALKISSPSQVARDEIGYPIMQGVSEGILLMEPDVTEMLSSAILKSVQGAKQAATGSKAAGGKIVDELVAGIVETEPKLKQKISDTLKGSWATLDTEVKSGKAKASGKALIEEIISGVLSGEQSLASALAKVAAKAVSSAKSQISETLTSKTVTIQEPVLRSDLVVGRYGPSSSGGVTVNIANATVREEADLSRIGSQVAYMVMARG